MTLGMRVFKEDDRVTYHKARCSECGMEERVDKKKAAKKKVPKRLSARSVRKINDFEAEVRRAHLLLSDGRVIDPFARRDAKEILGALLD